jgi:DNA-directed RNA polymerase subunit F
MKLGEFEAFEKAITVKIAENPQYARLTNILEEASSLMTNEELGRITDYIDRKLSNIKYTRTYIRPLFEDADIA